MARRTRITRKLIQPLTLESLSKARWNRIISIGLLVVSLLWISRSGFSSNRVYSAGPISKAHRIVADKCSACHAQAAVWGTKVSDNTCQTCHNAPVHQAQQLYTPTCASCHEEHRGSMNLSATSDRSCTPCHSDLKVKEGKLRYAAHIDSFTDGHPEFAAVRPGHPEDPGGIKLNHKVHLKKDLKGPNGPVQLLCSDCHHPLLPDTSNTVSARTSYRVTMISASGDVAASTNGTELAQIATDRKHPSPEMGPVTFQKDCKSCHPLFFDKRFADPAPHADTQSVDAYVTAKYTEYIAQHPGEVHDPVELSADLPSRVRPTAPRNANEWVSQRVEEAERLLFQKDCKECHQLSYPAPASRPTVPPANETVHWMKNAWFSHTPHQLVACIECHADAPKSEKTQDVLLPGIDTCKRCHNTRTADSAGSQCSECHVYHDWSKEKPVKNAPTITELLSR